MLTPTDRYSGVAWATKVDLENREINPITSWPGTGLDEGKAPTELCYDEAGELLWGFDIPPDVDRFSWFKLLLLRTEDLDPDIQSYSVLTRMRSMLEESGRTAVELVTAYLRLLWSHTMSTIERARGEVVLEALVIHVVITVPAIWKGYARQAMEDAAKAAGILEHRLAGPTNVTIVPEPEAAALSALLDRADGVQVGNVYVVCDAGGGTVVCYVPTGFESLLNQPRTSSVTK
jgi:hypothetical protein